MVSAERSPSSPAPVDCLPTVEGFKRKRVLLVGDTIVDIYVYGTAIGKSAETPTLVARDLRTTSSLGGAFLVARNLLELGAQVDFVTLVGGDAEAATVRDYSHPCYTGLLVEDRVRRTTVKKRFWVDDYKLLQFDTLDNQDLADDLAISALAKIGSRIEACDAVVVSDYRHGLLTPRLAQGVVALCQSYKKTLYVDSQVSQASANHTLYFGADTVVLNTREAAAIDPLFDRKEQAIPALERIRKMLGARNIVVKMGAEGAAALVSGRVVRAAAPAMQAIDTCGAGDAFLAALCLAGWNDPDISLLLANRWAGFSTLVHGTSPPECSTLIDALEAAG
jgi:D-beta-D-heptose 7-phosphate kinase/D-beta-D-heptose 1-phosphate adenosyltransferase